MQTVVVTLAFLACAGRGLGSQRETKHQQSRAVPESLERQSKRSLQSLALLLSEVKPLAAWQVAGQAAPSYPFSQTVLTPARRAGNVKLEGLFQAFDLMPLLNCFSAADTNLCLEQVEPWLFVDQNGQLTLSAAAEAGLAGGSIATLGSIATFLSRKSEVKDRLKCIYCEGTGRIASGDGSGGTVVCINCQGSGRSIPEDFLRRLGDEEQGFSEDDLIGLFDELPQLREAASASTAKAAAPASKTDAGKTP